jgi:hypothetical protein
VGFCDDLRDDRAGLAVELGVPTLSLCDFVPSSEAGDGASLLRSFGVEVEALAALSKCAPLSAASSSFTFSILVVVFSSSSI